MQIESKKFRKDKKFRIAICASLMLCSLFLSSCGLKNDSKKMKGDSISSGSSSIIKLNENDSNFKSINYKAKQNKAKQNKSSLDKKEDLLSKKFFYHRKNKTFIDITQLNDYRDRLDKEYNRLINNEFKNNKFIDENGYLKHRKEVKSKLYNHLKEELSRIYFDLEYATNFLLNKNNPNNLKEKVIDYLCHSLLFNVKFKRLKKRKLSLKSSGEYFNQIIKYVLSSNDIETKKLFLPLNSVLNSIKKIKSDFKDPNGYRYGMISRIYINENLTEWNCKLGINNDTKKKKVDDKDESKSIKKLTSPKIKTKDICN